MPRSKFSSDFVDILDKCFQRGHLRYLLGQVSKSVKLGMCSVHQCPEQIDPTDMII